MWWNCLWKKLKDDFRLHLDFLCKTEPPYVNPLRPLWVKPRFGCNPLFERGSLFWIPLWDFLVTFDGAIYGRGWKMISSCGCEWIFDTCALDFFCKNEPLIPSCVSSLCPFGRNLLCVDPLAPFWGCPKDTFLLYVLSAGYQSARFLVYKCVFMVII